MVMIQTFLLLTLMKAGQTHEPILTQGCKRTFHCMWPGPAKKGKTSGFGSMVDYAI